MLDSHIPRSPTDAEPFIPLGNGRQTIYFLHGLFGRAMHWLPVMVGLEDRCRMLAVEFPLDRRPGRRQSGVKTVSDLTDFVERVVDQQGDQEFILCGNSLGGLVAVDYCLRHPKRVTGLVLSGSAGLYEANLAGGKRPQASREWIREQAMAILNNHELVTDELVEGMYEDISDRDYSRFVLRMSRATRDHTVKDQLGRVSAPTLLIWGENDQITPPSVGEEFRDRIPNAELVFVEQCGHSPNLEQPMFFTESMRTFLDSLSDTPASSSD